MSALEEGANNNVFMRISLRVGFVACYKMSV
jgi:hypothetical protein